MLTINRPQGFTLDLGKLNFTFRAKPLLVGGKAMEYYGLRKAGGDIDLVITRDDYLRLAAQFPNDLKEIWGDLGVCPLEFESWQTIMLFDYDYWRKDALEEDEFLVISLDRLLFSRVLAMHVEKYRIDLNLVRDKILTANWLERVKYLPNGVLGEMCKQSDLVCTGTVVSAALLDGGRSLLELRLEEKLAGAQLQGLDPLLHVEHAGLANCDDYCLVLLKQIDSGDRFVVLNGGQGFAKVVSGVLSHSQPEDYLGRELDGQPLGEVAEKIRKLSL